ncbi:MAG: succinate dehydrogenase [Rhodobacterales bacterium]|nr:MAG: succinate dehydrogenase [Rhodobacterales bacterium]
MRQAAKYLFLTAGIALMGCAPNGLVDDASRKAAKSVVTPIVQEKFPGRNAAAYSDCVINNASSKQIFSLAKAAVVGPDADDVATVIDIASKGRTIECILKAELAMGLR